MSSSSAQGYVLALYNPTSIFLLPPANPPLIGHTQRNIQKDDQLSLLFCLHKSTGFLLAVLTPYRLIIQKEKEKNEERW